MGFLDQLSASSMWFFLVRLNKVGSRLEDDGWGLVKGRTQKKSIGGSEGDVGLFEACEGVPSTCVIVYIETEVRKDTNGPPKIRGASGSSGQG